MPKAPKNIEALVAKKNLSRRSFVFEILYMSCNHLPEKWKGWTILFLSGGRGGAFFPQKYFFVTKSFGDLRMNFISLVCNIFLCSMLLCTISIFSAKAVQEIFVFAFAQPPPSKIKWFVRSRDKTVLFESHSFHFAFSIISYRHAARNVFVQFFKNS